MPTNRKIVALSIANMLHRRATDENITRARTPAERIAIRKMGSIDYWQPRRGGGKDQDQYEGVHKCQRIIFLDSGAA